MARVTLRPVWAHDPPVWDTDKGPIPPQLDKLLVPLPPSAESNVKAVVAVPFYTETGYTLERSLQALALQRRDLRKYMQSRQVSIAQAELLPELHVFLIADGWKQEDGTRILSDSMLESIMDIFGPTLDIERLLEYMGDIESESGRGDPASPSRKQPLPDCVLVQLESTVDGGPTPVLHPLTIDCTWAAAANSRNFRFAATNEAVNIVARAERNVERGERFEKLRTRQPPASNGGGVAWGRRKSIAPTGGRRPSLAPTGAAFWESDDATGGVEKEQSRAAPGGRRPSIASTGGWRPSLDSTEEAEEQRSPPREEAGGRRPSLDIPDDDESQGEMSSTSARAQDTLTHVGLLSSSPVESVKSPTTGAKLRESTPLLTTRSSSLRSQFSDSLTQRLQTEDELTSGDGVDDEDSDVASNFGDDDEALAALYDEEYMEDSVTETLYVTLLIKRKNGKKHHSHRWFFEAFAPVTRLRSHGGCPYYFATDCGTLYAPYMLAELIRHMDRHPKCAAATGHQRLMDACDQEAPDHRGDVDAGFGVEFMASWMRKVQSYDVEAGLCIFNGMHANAGFLPVIPGPCGLFRAQSLTKELLGQVRNICSSKTFQDGLLQGNLKIAEDRIVSLLLVLPDKSSKGYNSTPQISWETHWVPSTTFFFESETSLQDLVLQRRRWLNGSSAGYLWMLGRGDLWYGLLTFRSLSWRVVGLTVLQIIVLSIVFLMPGLMAIMGFFSFSGIYTSLLCVGLAQPGPDPTRDRTIYGYLGLLLTSYLVHVIAARWGSTSFTTWIWSVRVALNAFSMVVNIVGTVSLTVISYLKPDVVVEAIGEDNFQDLQIAGAVSMLYMSTPFFLALLHSPGSALFLLKNYIPYLLFSPTIVGDLFAYSIARFDDISWGTKKPQNRPSVAEGEDFDDDDDDVTVGGRRKGAARAKLLAARRPKSLVAKRAQWRQQASQKMADVVARSARMRITLLTAFQLLMSFALVFLSIWLNSIFRQYLLVIGVILCIAGFSIMTLSMMYFAPHAIWRRGAGGCVVRSLGLAVFLVWCAATAAVVGLILEYNYKSKLTFWNLVGLYGSLALLLVLGAVRLSIAYCRKSRHDFRIVRPPNFEYF